MVVDVPVVQVLMAQFIDNLTVCGGFGGGDDLAAFTHFSRSSMVVWS